LKNTKILSLVPLLAVASAVVGFFSIGTGSEFVNYTFRVDSNLYLTLLFSSILLLFLAYQLLLNRLTYSFSNLILLFSIFIFSITSYLINGRGVNLAYVQFFILLCIIFSNLNFHFDKKIVNRVINYFVVINVLAAAHYMLALELTVIPVVFSDSFRGLAFDRVELSLILSCFLCWSLYHKNYVVSAAICFLIVLSESRSGILCVLIISLLHFPVRFGLFLVMSMCVVATILLGLSSRSEALFTISERVDLVSIGLMAGTVDLKSIIVGAGGLYTSVNSFAPHNNLIQTFLNFGLVGILSYLLFLLFILKKLSRDNIAIISVFLIFGISHQDLDMFSFTVKNITWLGFFMAMSGLAHKENMKDLELMSCQFPKHAYKKGVAAPQVIPPLIT